MNTLVFGGNGFIGSHLVDELMQAGHSVRVFDRLPERFRFPRPGVDYRSGHFGDAFSMAEALQDIEVVYHLISTTVPGTSNLNPVADISDNLIATVVLLEQMAKVGVKRIVYLSSGGTVYGNPINLPIAEDHPLHPICSYGVVKVAVENYLAMYQELYGIHPTIIRPSNPFGPRQGHLGVQGVIATFLARIYDNQPLNVWGDGSIVRDYIAATDLVRLCRIVGELSIGGVFNAGSGRGISISDLIAVLIEVTGRQTEVAFEPSRKLDVKEVVLDISHATSSAGWSPSTDFAEEVDRHWRWYSSLREL